MDNQDNIEPDGQFDAKVEKYDCVKTVSTELAADGVEETKIDYVIKQASQWTFGSLGKRYERNYETIDWSDG